MAAAIFVVVKQQRKSLGKFGFGDDDDDDPTTIFLNIYWDESAPKIPSAAMLCDFFCV